MAFDDQSLQQRLGPFLESHNHFRPSEDQAGTLIATLIKTELNRSDSVITDQSRARINPLLLDVCDQTYKDISRASDKLICFKERFNSLPRAVLECCSREKLLPEYDFILLDNRIHSMQAKTQDLFSCSSNESKIVRCFSASSVSLSSLVVGGSLLLYVLWLNSFGMYQDD